MFDCLVELQDPTDVVFHAAGRAVSVKGRSDLAGSITDPGLAVWLGVVDASEVDLSKGQEWCQFPVDFIGVGIGIETAAAELQQEATIGLLNLD